MNRADKQRFANQRRKLDGAYDAIAELEQENAELKRDIEAYQKGAHVHDLVHTEENKIKLLQKKLEKEIQRAEVYKIILKDFKTMNFARRLAFLFTGGKIEEEEK